MKQVNLIINKLKESEIQDLILRFITIVVLLYLFLIGVKCLSSGVKLMGGDFAKTLFEMSNQPLISLMAGMLATVLFQSSSVTTAIIVGLVSGGTLSIGGAVPMIMGANLGTSITNTLVSLGYMKDTVNFKKAFAAATVHDFFNILSVAILLPIELMTGFIEKTATYLSSFLYGSIAGFKYTSPIKAMIKPPVKAIKSFTVDTFGADVAGIVLMIIAGIIIISALSFIVKTMKVLVESHKAGLINKALSKNAYSSILFGIVMTISVQSSSITTSLLIPMAGSGVLSLSSIYPITIGANIGTTATALIAALTGNVAGLSIALVHFLFNIIGALIFFPVERMRNIPIKCAEALADTIDRTKMIGLGYVGVVFFILPLTLIFLTN
jgi:sodium-dependent phosphate cotransporter